MKQKPTNKDYGRRHYVSDDDYQTAMRRVPDKAVYNENIVKQSEFKKPYRSDSKTYEEMEYHYPNFSVPDYVPPQPNADMEAEVPGTDLYDYGLVYCWGDLCYCPGQLKCFDISCTYPLIRAWFNNPLMGVSVSGKQICINTSPGVSGSQTLWYDLQLLRAGKKTSVAHLFKIISECSSCCGCTGISIGYTTQQMSVNGTQTLTVVGAVEGCTYDWAISSGGGSLSSATGTSVVYTAPATNANCTNNPTITLSVSGIQCGSLKIAVTPAVVTCGQALAKACVKYLSGYGWICCWLYYNCGGVMHPVWCSGSSSHCQLWGCTANYQEGSWHGVIGSGLGTEAESVAACWGIYSGYVDVRTDAMKAAGCCPSQFL